MLPAALTSHSIDDAIFHVASVLEVPVLIAALAALALVLYELGAFTVECWGRRRRRFTELLGATGQARTALDEADVPRALAAVTPLCRSAPMRDTLRFIVEHARESARPGSPAPCRPRCTAPAADPARRSST